MWVQGSRVFLFQISGFRLHWESLLCMQTLDCLGFGFRGLEFRELLPQKGQGYLAQRAQYRLMKEFARIYASTLNVIQGIFLNYGVFGSVGSPDMNGSSQNTKLLYRRSGSLRRDWMVGQQLFASCSLAT